MNATRPELTQERLKERLHYDPATGWWINLVQRGKGGRARPGTMAGCINEDGYRVIKIDGIRYLASRLAHFYMRGEWPPADIDHRDRNRSNDRWLNLRPATRSQNCVNKAAPCRLLPRGVYPERDRFRAKIRHQRKITELGIYDTPALASLAYLAAARKLHGEFAALA